MRLQKNTGRPLSLDHCLNGSALALLMTMSACGQLPEKPVSNEKVDASTTTVSKTDSDSTPTSVQESTGALDANSHLLSPEYKSEFKATTIPLDATLSWMNRFTGDENFNESEVLVPMLAGDKTQSVPSLTARAMDSKVSNEHWDTTGIVRSVRLESGKIKIKHEAIESMDMPAMTMVFSVEDRALLTGLESNQEVGFNVENTAGGFFITNIIRLNSVSPETQQGVPVQAVSTSESSTDTAGVAESSASATMDARGIVKTIRVEQGKIKIQHGPIERIGMPAMTMMFSVKDPTLLQGVTKGIEVNFDVNNTAGGFVITNIKPVKHR